MRQNSMSDPSIEREALVRTGAATDALYEEAPPERIGAYRIVTRIGRGGMGSVYRGERDAGDFVHVAAIRSSSPGLLSESLHPTSTAASCFARRATPCAGMAAFLSAVEPFDALSSIATKRSAETKVADAAAQASVLPPRPYFDKSRSRLSQCASAGAIAATGARSLRPCAKLSLAFENSPATP